MRAAVLQRPRDLRVEDVDDPEIRDHDVMIHVSACGICGTDMHIYNGEFPATFPLIMGHEFSGDVMDVGPRVTNVERKDRVTVDPTIACNTCEPCRRGEKNFCLNSQATGVTRNGAFAELISVPETAVYKIPDSMDYMKAAMVEPLACCIHGHEIIKISHGDTVTITGAGPIGLMHLQLSMMAGASKVMITDIVRQRLSVAEELGADVVIDGRVDDVSKRVFEETSGRGTDVLIEATGNVKVLAEALGYLRGRGKMMVFAVYPQGEKVEIEPFKIYRNELLLSGVYTNPYTMQRSISLISSGRVSVRPLVSHTFTLEEINKAFSLAMGEKEKVRKIIILPNERKTQRSTR